MSQPHTSALVVVDMQNDYIAKSGYYDELAKLTSARGGKLSEADIDAMAHVYEHPPASSVLRDGYGDLTARVAEVAAAALAVQMPTIFVRTTYDPPSCYKAPLFIGRPDRRDYPCHPDTWGAELVDQLRPLAADKGAGHVEKHTFDAFFETDLRGLLRFHRVETLYVAGVETNVCVLCTALSALSNGIKAVVLEDCVTTSVPELHAPALRIIEVARGKRIESRKLLAELGPASRS